MARSRVYSRIAAIRFSRSQVLDIVSGQPPAEGIILSSGLMMVSRRFCASAANPVVEARFLQAGNSSPGADMA